MTPTEQDRAQDRAEQAANDATSLLIATAKWLLAVLLSAAAAAYITGAI